MRDTAFNSLSQPDEPTTYWLGYLLGVGEIIDGKLLRVRIPSQRVKELEALKGFLDIPNALADDGRHVMLRLVNPVLVSSLIMAGLVPKTTVLDTSAPVHLESSPVLWKGVIDASGMPTSASAITVRGKGRGSLLKQLVGYARGLDSGPGDVEVEVTPGGVATVRFAGDSARVIFERIQNVSVGAESNDYSKSSVDSTFMV